MCVCERDCVAPVARRRKVVGQRRAVQRDSFCLSGMPATGMQDHGIQHHVTHPPWMHGKQKWRGYERDRDSPIRTHRSCWLVGYTPPWAGFAFQGVNFRRTGAGVCARSIDVILLTM